MDFWFGHDCTVSLQSYSSFPIASFQLGWWLPYAISAMMFGRCSSVSPHSFVYPAVWPSCLLMIFRQHPSFSDFEEHHSEKKYYQAVAYGSLTIHRAGPLQITETETSAITGWIQKTRLLCVGWRGWSQSLVLRLFMSAELLRILYQDNSFLKCKTRFKHQLEFYRIRFFAFICIYFRILIK